MAFYESKELRISSIARCLNGSYEACYKKAAPFQGRVIPFHIHNYSPGTFNRDNSSRNIEHGNSLSGIVDILRIK